MRYLFTLLCIAVLLLGLLFGALNPQAVTIDLYFLSLPASLGVALLGAVLLGALVGGMCAALALAMQARRRRRRDALRERTDERALVVVDAEAGRTP